MYYKLELIFEENISYKSILFDNIIPLFPKVYLPNILFTNLLNVKDVKELEEINKNTIYFCQKNHLNKLDMRFDGLNIKKYSLITISVNEFIKNVNLFRLRKLQDLELLNYYINLGVLKTNDVFIDRFNGHYSFFKNPDVLDKYFSNHVTKINDKINDKINNKINDKINVLYCLFFSPQYEEIGYTIRSHNLIKSVNSTNNVNIIGVSRYGYPFDKKKEYYQKKGLGNCNIDGVKYEKLLNGEDNFNTNNILDYIKKYVLILIDKTKELNIDIIHCASNWWNGIAGYYASKVLGIPCIYEVRGFWDESSVALRPELIGSDLIQMKIKMERFVLSRVTKILTINDNLKDEIINRCHNVICREDISIIYNGVDSIKFNINTNTIIQYQQKFNLDDKTIVFGYIGSLLNYEGIDYILTGIKKLKENGYNVKFIMAGGGKEEDKLLNLAKELYLTKNEFEFIGKIDHSNISNYYNMFDIVVYPRRDNKVCRTTSSSKIFETMCMGKAIIVSKLPAYAEIIEDMKNGIYCNPDDQDDIYNKMEKLINNKELRSYIGKNARDWVINNRNWLNIANKLVNIYGNIITGTSNTRLLDSTNKGI